jgi:homopolymeric O-antigen transport system permease protein
MGNIEIIAGAWRFRGFIWASVKREFSIRYQGTQLGIFWPMLQPLASILVYTLVFGGLMRSSLGGHEGSRFAYSIYLTAGLITWTLFAELLMRSVGIFLENANLLKKVNVPKLAFPIIASISGLIHYAIILALFLVFLIGVGEFPGLALIAIMPVLAIVVLLAVGLGVLLGTVNVFYRDVAQTLGIVVQFWFWLTPIVYNAAALPPWLQTVLAWNPMWPAVRAMHDIFVEHRFPAWGSLGYPLAMALVFLALAKLAFEKLANELVDEL